MDQISLKMAKLGTENQSNVYDESQSNWNSAGCSVKVRGSESDWYVPYSYMYTFMLSY